MTRIGRLAWITGASSGIGAALAAELARAGLRVAASARRAAELQALAVSEPGIVPFPLDVTDLHSMRETYARIEAGMGPIDVAILNAGMGRRMGVRDFDPQLAADMMAVNYLGVVNGLGTVMGPMVARRSGRIAIVSSLAAYRGFPRAAGYSASKAAVDNLVESLRPELEAAGVTLSLVSPGYVATEMTARASRPLPFLMSSEEAARRIVRGLEAGRRGIVFPWQTAALCSAARLMPDRMFFWLMRRARS